MTINIFSQQPDTAAIRHTVDSTQCVFDPPLAAHTDTTGTLYITEHALMYFSAAESFGFSIDYQGIVIHAISRSEEQSTGSSLYCQLDCAFPNTRSENEDSDDEEDGEEFSEVRFFPSSADDVDTMFRIMSECAALNPDPDMEESDDEDTLPHIDSSDSSEDADSMPGAVQEIGSFDPSSFITSEDQLDQLTPEGRKTLDRLESLVAVPDSQNHYGADRFADAD
ncbi:Methylosome subunit pICln [Linderina pennispora]|nr:Methylosome subunit pICln [Linderina pennispora]